MAPGVWSVVSVLLVLVIALYSTEAEADRVVRQTSSSAIDNRGPSCSTNYQFDHFVLAIQWPLSFCYDKQECNLAIARKKKWLIHGLWPSRGQRSNKPKRSGGGGNGQDGARRASNDIAFCCGPAYNATSISPAMNQELLEKWPTLHANGKHHGFWKHEWQKHGTCSRQLAQLKTQQAYFETVLGLYNRFDMNRAPLQSNQTYQVNQFHEAIEPLVGGKRVRIECSLSPPNNNNNNNGRPNKPRPKRGEGEVQAGGSGGASRTSIFAEVHICLDKTLQPVDCGRNDDHQCKKRVLFP